MAGIGPPCAVCGPRSISQLIYVETAATFHFSPLYFRAHLEIRNTRRHGRRAKITETATAAARNGAFFGPTFDGDGDDDEITHKCIVDIFTVKKTATTTIDDVKRYRKPFGATATKRQEINHQSNAGEKRV